MTHDLLPVQLVKLLYSCNTSSEFRKSLLYPVGNVDMLRQRWEVFGLLYLPVCPAAWSIEKRSCCAYHLTCHPLEDYSCYIINYTARCIIQHCWSTFILNFDHHNHRHLTTNNMGSSRGQEIKRLYSVFLPPKCISQAHILNTNQQQ